jgi:serine O-acetyltransferase
MIEAIWRDIQRYKKDEDNLFFSIIKAAYTHPAFIGVLWYRIGHALWLRRKNPLFFILLILHRILYPLVRIQSGLELSPRTDIGPGLYIAHFGPTVIHPETIAGCNLTLLQGVTIGANKSGVPQIGDNVSIATGARVIGKIKLGDNSIVGAGAVVIKDVLPGTTVVGIPAKPIHSEEVLHVVGKMID